MAIAEKIKAIRKERGLTQKQFGDLCGIHEVQIRKYERGEVTPKMENIKKIADGLGIHPSDLIGMEWFDLELGPEKLSELRDSVNALHTISKVFGEPASDLVAKFTELNSSGQQKALDYVSDLTEQAKYQK